jgi:hypothetical protein
MEADELTEMESGSSDSHRQPERQTDPGSPQSPSRTDPDSYTTGGKIALVSSIGLSFSALLPWVSLDLDILNLSSTAIGTDTAGILTLPIGVLMTAGILYSPGQWTRQKFSAVMVLGVVSSVVGIAYLADPTIAVEIPRGISEENVRQFINAEIGVYSTLLSSIGVTIGSVLGKYD